MALWVRRAAAGATSRVRWFLYCALSRGYALSMDAPSLGGAVGAAVRLASLVQFRCVLSHQTVDFLVLDFV